MAERKEILEIPREIEITRTSDKGRMCWVDPQTGKTTLIEKAVAGYFRKNGLIVPYGESLKAETYGHAFNAFMLSLMFEKYDHKNFEHKEIFEDLLVGNLKLYSRPALKVADRTWAYVEPRIEEHKKRFAEAKERTAEQIHANLKTVWKYFVQREKLGRSYFGGDLAPGSMVPFIFSLYTSLGVDRFLKCEDLRVSWRSQGQMLGWPDLAIWSENNFAFIEVKGPNDYLRGHQKVCLEALKKMDIRAEVLKVSAA